jgi:4-amino-4-deoxy-L-arabinose transferase-like glycosyltransferase
MPERSLAARLFVLAYLIRVVSWLTSPLFGTDGGHFLLMADWIGQGRFDDALRMAYHPGYPLLISLVRLPIGDTILAGHLVAAALGSAAVVPLYFLAARFFGGPAALVTGLLYAFNPSLIELQSDVMTEGPFLFFLFSSMELTWRAMGDPAPERSAALGFVAAGAYFVRPEGLIAVAFALGWPAVELLRKRDRPAARLGGLLVTTAVIALVCAPYLFWIRAVKGHAALSIRPSLESAHRAVGILLDPGVKTVGSWVYVEFLKGIYRLTYLITIPFYLIGLREQRGGDARHRIFFFSMPVGYLAAVLWTLQSHAFSTYRYVVAPMSLLMVLPALGLVATTRWISQRWAGTRWLPLACGGLVTVVAVLPGARAFKGSREELRSFPEAARWIRAQGPVPRGMSGPAQQVAYLSGCPSYYSALTPEDLREQIRQQPVDYYVYTEKDVRNRPAYVAMLRSCDLLRPPVEIEGPPGTLRVYIQRVK